MGATPNVAVLAVARTAVRPVDGELAGWNPVELAGVVGREVLERAGLDSGVLDEVVVGCADPVGACGADAARAIVLAAGWPVTVGGLVVDRGETSGMAAVQTAVAASRSGQARTVLVVGLGLCSVVPPGAAALNRTYGAPWGGVAERFADRGGLLPAPRLSERAAAAAGFGRADLDAAAEESRRRRTEAAAIVAGANATSLDAARSGDASPASPAGANATSLDAARSGDASPASPAGANATSLDAARSGDASPASPAGANATSLDAARPGDASPASPAGANATSLDATQPGDASPAIVAVAARPGAASGRGVYRGDPVGADFVRDWGDAAELPPTFDEEGLLTAATFAPPADCVAAVLMQAVAQPPGTSDLSSIESANQPNDPGPAALTRTAEAQAQRGGRPTGTAAADGLAAPATGEGTDGHSRSRAPAAANGLAALATVAGMGRAAGDPFDPVGDVAVAVERALGEAGVDLDGVDDIAVVEHDAATVGLVARALGVDAGRLNRAGGAVATGNAGAAEELRLITDGLAYSTDGLLLTISAGPTGSAAILWNMNI